MELPKPRSFLCVSSQSPWIQLQEGKQHHIGGRGVGVGWRPFRGRRGPPAQQPETRPGSHSWTGSIGRSHWSALADPSTETWESIRWVRADNMPTMRNKAQEVDEQLTGLPLQVGVMSWQNIFHQSDCLAVGFLSQLLGKVEFSTQEVAYWPQPLLLTRTHKIYTVMCSEKDKNIHVWTASSIKALEEVGELYINSSSTVKVQAQAHSLVLGGSWSLLPGCSCHCRERCHRHRSTPCH